MRKISLYVLTGVLLLIAAGCGTKYSGPPADLVIKNGKILTIDPDNPHAEAIAVIGEKIIAVADNGSIDQYIQNGHTKVIDAKNRLIVPGFNDAHAHFTSGGASLMNLDFRYVHNVEKIQQMVKEKVAQSKPGELIVGRGWEHETFPDKKWPTKEILDAVAPNNPVALRRADGHSIWVNSYVIKASGITRRTPDPPGGTIVHDPKTGEPTGIFKEKAMNLLTLTSSVELTAEEKDERADKALQLALNEAKRLGVTSVQHLTGSFDRIRKFKDQDKLTTRITINMPMPDGQEGLIKLDSLRKAYPRENNWIRFGYLKSFMDGTLGSGTALMFEPFDDAPETSGLPMMPYEEYERKIVAADKMGFQTGTHAIGDKANNWVLNAIAKAIETNGKRDHRHRSEHAQILKPNDIPRFAELGAIASMQPTHCITDKRFAEKRIGKERCKGAYAWQSLLKTGAHLAFGTDWSVEPLDPMEGLYAAVTRKDRAGEPGDGWFPKEKLTMEKAIELYTLGSAYAEFMENRKGMLKDGYLADIVIVNQDLLTIEPDKIMKTKVDYTITGGKVVYMRSGGE